MVHYGKHIIDPETGLCEICDRGAIHEIRHAKRPGKQFLYSNKDGRFTYRPVDGEIRNNNETTPRRVRKPLYTEPPARSRPVVHQEPVVVQKKVTRRNYSPPDDIQYTPPTNPATFYHLDNTGQTVPRNEIPQDESRRRYLVQNQQSPPTRPARVIYRRAQTPPPPASESWRSRSNRENNSDIAVLERPYRAKSDNPYSYQSPRKPEVYYVETPYDSYVPPPKIIYQDNTNRKQRQLEPVERKHYIEPEPTVIRRVYKKLPPRTYEPSEREYLPNGNYIQPVRKIEKIYPSPRQYQSSPQLTNKHVTSPLPNKYPSVYYLQSGDEY